MPFLTDLRANLNLGYDYQHGENHSNDFINTPKAWNNGYTVLESGNRINIKDGGVGRKYEFRPVSASSLISISTTTTPSRASTRLLT